MYYIKSQLIISQVSGYKNRGYIMNNNKYFCFPKMHRWVHNTHNMVVRTYICVIKKYY